MTNLKAATRIRRDAAHRLGGANDPGCVAQVPETFFEKARKRMA
jgi:hypothetical protein